VSAPLPHCDSNGSEVFWTARLLVLMVEKRAYSAGTRAYFSAAGVIFSE